MMTATTRLPGQAKVARELARADLAAGHTRLRPADAYAPGRNAGRFVIKKHKQDSKIEIKLEKII